VATEINLKFKKAQEIKSLNITLLKNNFYPVITI